MLTLRQLLNTIRNLFDKTNREFCSLFGRIERIDSTSSFDGLARLRRSLAKYRRLRSGRIGLNELNTHGRELEELDLDADKVYKSLQSWLFEMANFDTKFVVFDDGFSTWQHATKAFLLFLECETNFLDNSQGGLSRNRNPQSLSS